MFVRLVLAGGLNVGMVAEIKEGYYLIGRNDECQIRPESLSVSDRHCLLRHEGKFFRVFVLDGDSPTLVNHKPLEPRKWVLLNHRDMLQVGNVAFLVAITAQDPRLPAGASPTTADQSSKLAKSRMPETSADRSPASVRDFAERDTAEIEIGRQEAETAEASNQGRWKRGAEKRKREKRPAKKALKKANQPPRASSRSVNPPRFDWRLVLAVAIVVIAVGAGAYGAYRFFRGSTSGVRVQQEID